MSQLSLFPDGFELREQTLAALRDLDPAVGLALLRREQATGVELPDFGALQQALGWLDGRLTPRPATAEGAARLLAQLGAEALAGRLVRAAAEFLDVALARFVAARAAPGRLFAADDGQVPGALAELVLGRARAARIGMQQVVGETASERGDHWGWLGDACLLDLRPEDAAAAYTRALLWDAAGIDWWRLRDRRLVACRERLLPVHGSEAADLVLAEAWLDGALAIPPANGWFTPGQVERLRAATSGPQASRCRRFSLLLWLDRTAARAGVDVARREQMQALLPDVFARFVRECDRRERGTQAR